FSKLLFLEQRFGGVEQRVVTRLRGEPALANLEELAKIRVVLIGRNLGEGFLALLDGGQIEVAAVPAGVQIGTAIRARLPTAQLIAHDLEGATAPRATGHDPQYIRKTSQV
ncbi:MAG TPA: hypothetical protein VN918_05930, partial [Myxococcaceae bacterium]|nr:hypothetical protein [Myxococcaceae bacterium]